jgi:hypothetical protein
MIPMSGEFTPSLLRIQTCSRLNLEPILKLNRSIFQEDRVINSWKHDVMIILLATYNEIPVGFKLGYGISSTSFYSAKGGVIQGFRRKGVATSLLINMMSIAKKSGFSRFGYHTFPHLHDGMLELGISSGFKIKSSKWNEHHEAMQYYLEKEIG